MSISLTWHFSGASEFTVDDILTGDEIKALGLVISELASTTQATPYR